MCKRRGRKSRAAPPDEGSRERIVNNFRGMRDNERKGNKTEEREALYKAGETEETIDK